MALPTLYVDTGGHAQGSGSTDAATPTAFDTSGASVSTTTVDLSASAPDLSGVLADGSQTIFINDATNSNRKLFKITAVDDTAKTVTVDTAPTGTISNSAWGIGGQFVYDSARVEGAMAAGWTLVFNNSPASKAGTFFTARASGSSSAGNIKVRGKTGVRPQLVVTGSNSVIAVGGGLAAWEFENLEFVQQGASANVVDAAGASGVTFRDVKVSDGGGAGILVGQGGRVLLSEVTGVGAEGVVQGDRSCTFGNHIHDITGAGIRPSAASCTISMNLLDTCGGQGINVSQTPSNFDGLVQIFGNTIYGCGNSGIQIDDADTSAVLFNNILSENGNAAGEYNVEWVAGSDNINSQHGYNLLFHSGGGGGANVSNFTVNATELTSDPSFTDAAGGDFSLGSSSPAKATGFPGTLLGNASPGYLDIGAVQREEPAGGGGGSGGARLIGGTVVR